MKDRPAGLDPTAEAAEGLRAALHRLVDAVIDRRLDARSGRPWWPLERRTQALFQSPLPEEGADPEATVDALLQTRVAHPGGHAHPRFFGWAMGASTLHGALGSVAAALADVNAFGGAQPMTLLEAEVLRWTAEALELPEHAHGVLTSGTSEANLLALAAAAAARLGPLDVPLHDRPRGAVLTSTRAHHSVVRASRVLGLGDPIAVDVDSRDRLRLDALEIELDRLEREGVRAVAIVATAGTPAAGAHDPIEGLAEIAAARQAWLHVDGAFGAWARLAPALADRVAGLERADSIAVDHHKALHAPYASGALLVRDPRGLDALETPSDYLHPFRGGLGGLQDWPGSRSLATSRVASAVGVWTTLRGLGRARLANEVQASHARAKALADALDRAPGWRVPVAPEGPCLIALPVPRDDRGVLRRVTRLQQDGEAVVTPVRRPEGLGLRISTLNHRTTEGDLRRLVHNLGTS